MKDAIDAGVEVSDGYHTFSELYKHRFVLWIALAKRIGSKKVWKSRLNADKTGFTGWFVMGCCPEKGKQISYHLPDEYWDKCAFARTRPTAPPFDGHTSLDVIKRIENL